MKSVCVYCGSRLGASEDYVNAAVQMASAIVERGATLVYGGASNGLMGALADEALRLGGHVIGVIPDFLVDRELAHPGLVDLRVTNSMHERKRLLANLADAFVALPGGLGTLEELSEIWTWSYLGLHEKPCGVLNTRGYFDPLLRFLDATVAEGFVDSHHRTTLIVEESPTFLLDRFEK